jgi:hypothetical protein
MDVGMMMVFASYGWDDCSDTRVWDEEIRTAGYAKLEAAHAQRSTAASPVCCQP